MKVYNAPLRKEALSNSAKIGTDKKVLGRAAAMELLAAYGVSFSGCENLLPFFSVGALGKMMFTNLIWN